MGMRFDPTSYGPVIAELLATERVGPLGPGRENEAMADQLERATVDRLFAHAKVVDRSMAEACRSGLWLYHDYLDTSHTISQSISTPTGSYWHGIMHRREPDFSNAKYWFRRVGRHPVPDADCGISEVVGQPVRRYHQLWICVATLGICVVALVYGQVG